jgi:hypothetical protein
MTIVNAGRTGVERGVYQGAVAAGLPVTGVCRRAHRDELGHIPSELAQLLTPCEDRGLRAAVDRCLAMSNAMLLVVPDRRDLSRFPHLVWVLKRARAAGLPVRIHDEATSLPDTIAWAFGEDRAVYITGPRWTRWSAGEPIARRLLRAVKPAEAIV